MYYQNGVTLFEVLIALAIVAIVSVMALPTMNASLQNSRVRTISTDFTSSLNYARSEAVKRDTPVSVCASQDTTNYNTCGTAADWRNGWITFIDPAGNGSIIATNRLGIRESFTGVIMTTTAGRVTFQGTGFLLAGATDYVINGTDCPGNYARLINVATTGRTSVNDGVCP
jgi:type IV fimbrial biogenesis protein FimT